MRLLSSIIKSHLHLQVPVYDCAYKAQPPTGYEPWSIMSGLETVSHQSSNIVSKAMITITF
jgi:hypothetical protein